MYRAPDDAEPAAGLMPTRVKTRKDTRVKTMGQITLKNKLQQTTTMIPNDFIDQHMKNADGEYVKIYLQILRLAGSNRPVDTDEIADMLDLTGKDVIRALKYWQKEGLLELTKDPVPEEKPKETAPAFPTPVPCKEELSAGEIEHRIKGTDLGRAVYMAEAYFGSPLTPGDLNTFCYIAETLHFSTELLEYLIEYCAEHQKKSMRYLERVALTWFQNGIDTVKKAKDATSQYTKNIFSVKKAFGIANRNLGQAELQYIDDWNELGFSPEIINEACSRTLLSTGQASFPYANKILTSWKNAGIRSVSDIRELDARHHDNPKEDRQNGRAARQKAAQGRTNSFHNFDQRSYDYDEMESLLLEKNRR